MTNFRKDIGDHTDLPLVASTHLPAATAGTGTDYESALFTVPTLASLASSGTAGMLPYNGVYARTLSLIPDAAITGAATNNFSWLFRVYNAAGTVQNVVNTTSATSVTSGSTAITPASMANIQVGQLLYFSGGTGSAETVQVASITGTTFTATFANNHSGAYTITATGIASVSYFTSGTTETAYVAHQFKPIKVLLAPGFSVTLQRVSNGTGLASPGVCAQIELVGPLGLQLKG